LALPILNALRSESHHFRFMPDCPRDSRTFLLASRVLSSMRPTLKGGERPQSRRRTGFTLIELLVVIGIVALLMALLFPVFSRVRENGRQAACLSGERQLGTAFLLYTQENDEVVPRVPYSWAGQIYPYVKSVGVFHCPDDATTGQPPLVPVSYGLNANLFKRVKWKQGLALKPRSMNEVSGKTVLFFEVSHVRAQITSPFEGWSGTSETPPAGASVEGVGGDGGGGDGRGADLSIGGTYADGYTFEFEEEARYATCAMSGAAGGPRVNDGDGRHHGGANFVFSDAHVKWLRPEQVSTGGTAAAPDSDPWHGAGHRPSAAGSENTKFAATFSTK